MSPAPGDRVVATAPVRVADVGGWTDTWFGAPGRVCHLAVGPGVRVEARVVPRGALPPAERDGGVVRLVAPDLGADYVVGPAPGQIGGDDDAEDRGWRSPWPGRHPLLEHAVAAVLEAVDLPPGVGVEVRVASAVPAGASLGTSASVVVAVIGALDALVAGGGRTPEEVAVLAHRVETARAGREAGVQDQWAAAVGGAQLLAVGPYPEVRRTGVELAPATVDELAGRLVTVVFGPHASSAVHGQVIDALVACGDVEHDLARRALRRLSELAGDAADALAAGDLGAWAEVLVASVDAQAALHPDLVGPAHRAAIEVARRLGAAGWKVNGAGGAGGSLTVVAGAGADAASAVGLAEALAALDPAWRVADLAPAPGLTVS